MIHLLALTLVLLLGGAGVAFAAQDVVITTSGDKLVGEIKKVEKDVLIFSTDYSDADFKIKWEKIATIQSTRQFVIETFDGQRQAVRAAGHVSNAAPWCQTRGRA